MLGFIEEAQRSVGSALASLRAIAANEQVHRHPLIRPAHRMGKTPEEARRLALVPETMAPEERSRVAAENLQRVEVRAIVDQATAPMREHR